ncbi:uncharacterized protein PV09_03182 [Verruconis gallopava]|uniref:Uncharacterized protein n=1 Tax=Verruconis gallopava TaxID=253628 RepID=A0A0D2B479_9PEZI|nr:uncharacterized protein PV09_03182 [Verruconis gallopava]KIW05999.1 hypothetical protein PV09_03182 [Verruconis gallopava]
MDALLDALGDELEDAEEEAFLLFSQQIPSHNLGFVDPRADTLNLVLAGKDVTIRQSPGLLESNRPAGTTGAVLWSITPLFANWVAAPEALLTRCGVLRSGACALELGCGVSGLLSLALAGRIGRYVNTDQDYVLRLAKENVEANIAAFVAAPPAHPRGKKGKGSGSAGALGSRQHKAVVRATEDDAVANVVMRPLDWEKSDVSTLYKDVGVSHIDVLFCCDCVYNEALIEPLATTMRDICSLADDDANRATVVVVAQQLRSPDVLEAWLKAFCSYFRVWRVPDHELGDALGEGSGYVVHIGILRTK